MPGEVRTLLERVAVATGAGGALGVLASFGVWLGSIAADGHGLDPTDVFAVGGSLGATIGSFVGLLFPSRRPRAAPPTLDEKIAELAARLRDASLAVGEIEREITERTRLVARLEEDVARHRALLGFRSDEVEAIAQTLRAQLVDSEQKSRRDQIVLGAIFFALGVIAAVVLELVS